MRTISALLEKLSFPNDLAISLIDVGARWGANAPWNQLDGKHVAYVGFEPDEEECRRLLASRGTSNVDYIPVALSDEVAQHTLHLTREAGCSSIFPPAARMSRYFLSERWDVQKRIPISAVPLASVLDEKGIVPDAIKVDVQGAAFKVLSGAGRYLDELLLIDVEVEFSEMYQGQSLFAEVDGLVRRHGFELLDLNKYHARRKILDSRHASRGQVLFADALYVVSVEAFYAREMSPAQRTRRLWSLLAMLCLHGHFDLALEFVCHERSTLTPQQQAAIGLEIRRHTAYPRWKLLLFDNAVAERLGFIAALLSNAMQIKSRRFGWGSDQSAVDTRYKYYFTHPVLRLFRK